MRYSGVYGGSRLLAVTGGRIGVEPRLGPRFHRTTNGFGRNLMTIRNPIEWGWAHLHDAALAVGSASRAVGRVHVGSLATPPAVRRITTDDVRAALRAGIDDFGAHRTDVIFLALIYPIAGLVLARVAF